MKQTWTKGLDEQDSKDVKANFKESLVVRKRLKTILEDKIGESRRVARSKSGYDNPNWAYLQADASGFERALDQIISLIEG